MSRSIKFTGIILLTLCLLYTAAPLGAEEVIPPHQLKLQADSGTFGKWELEVWLNDDYVGKITKWKDLDVTPKLKWGKNIITIKADWKEDTHPVELTIGVKRGEKWMTAFNYVRRSKGSEVRKYTLSVSRGLPEKPLVTGQYVMKISADSGTLGAWTITPIINDRQAGTYTSWANADVSYFIRPGKNVVVVKGDWLRNTHEVKLTIGQGAGEKWSTVVNCAHSKAGKLNKIFKFDAKGIAGAATDIISKHHILKVSTDTSSIGKWEVEVSINGEIVQTLTAPSSIPINDYLKPGKNTLTLKGELTDKITPLVITVGAKAGEKWSTLVKFARQDKGAFDKKYTFIAK